VFAGGEEGTWYSTVREEYVVGSRTGAAESLGIGRPGSRFAFTCRGEEAEESVMLGTVASA
jgi:hypothetical protein